MKDKFYPQTLQRVLARRKMTSKHMSDDLSIAHGRCGGICAGRIAIGSTTFRRINSWDKLGPEDVIELSIAYLADRAARAKIDPSTISILPSMGDEADVFDRLRTLFNSPQFGLEARTELKKVFNTLALNPEFAAHVAKFWAWVERHGGGRTPPPKSEPAAPQNEQPEDPDNPPTGVRIL